MAVRTFEGIVVDGSIRLPAEVALAEKTKVYVVIPEADAPPQAHARSPRLAHPEQASDFVKEIVEDATDAEL